MLCLLLHRRRFVLALAAAAILPLAVASAGCGSGGDLLSGESQQRAELERARAIWRNSGVRSYRFTALSSAAPVAAVRLRSSVLAQTVLSSEVREVGTEQVVERPGLVEAYGTVERMFDTIGDAIEQGEDDDRLDLHVQVEYDAARGYPTSVQTYVADPNVADGGASFTVTSFEVLD